MPSLFVTFQNRFNEWLAALGEHLQISLLSLMIALLIGVPLAALLSRSKRGQTLCYR